MTEDRVHAIGYQRIAAPGRRASAIWPIARTLVTLALKRRATKLALILCLGVVVGHGIWLTVQLLSVRFAAELGMRAGAFRLQDAVGNVQEVLASYLQIQFYFTTPAIAVVAGGAIADDRRAGAFELYFSRPLTRLSYGLGKIVGTAAVPLTTLFLATLILWLAAVGIAPPHIRADLWSLALPALVGAGLATAVLTAGMVGMSALARRSTGVAVAFVALLLLGSAVAEGLAESHQLWGGYLSPERDLRTLFDALLEPGASSFAGSILGGRARVNPSVAGSALALGLYIAAGLGALWAGIRREVTS
ncbi:MAG: ABC transporter permease subunit [Myxococcales bacterium]|nr:ABC transporter permease subunit [Myxococcales bacterium]